MTRIGTLGANTAFVNRILDIQTRVQTEQVQVTSGLKAQSYDGIASGTNTVINFQNEQAIAQRFIDNNNVWNTKLEAATTAIAGVKKTLTIFRDSLQSFRQNNPKNEQNIKSIQNTAFQTLQSIAADLGTNVNGQYLFSGGRVSDVPIQLPAGSLTEFQSLYDGSINTVSTTRNANLQEVSISKLEATAMSFNGTNGVITPAKADAFKNVYAGSRITVSESTAQPPNNGDFTVKSKAMCNIAGTPLAEGNSTTNVISFGTTPTNILDTATGQLNFTFAPDGTMNMSANTAGSLSAMTVGSKFTISPQLAGGSATTGYEGAYEVVSNKNGVVNFKTSYDVAKDESVASTALTFGVNGAAQANPATAGTLNFTSTSSAVTGKTTVTLNAATGATIDFAAINVGDQLTLGGTSGHNGTFTVTAATATSVSFEINPEGARVSQLLPQTGRTDVKMSFLDANLGATVTRDSTNFTSLSFSPTGTAGERITSTDPNGFKDQGGNPYPPIDTIITTSSTTGVNDGVYKVVANNGNYIEIASVGLTNESLSTKTKIDSSTWYKGDTLQLQHRVDIDRTVDVGIYASDPAFEKGIRALSLIAQGQFGTAGGLDSHQERISQALYLVNDALESPAAGTPPFGKEKTGDVKSVASLLDGTRKTISLKNEKHTQFIGFLSKRVADIAQVDKTEIATKMLSDQTALEGSYQILAQLKNLSLLNYMK
ncbi:Flagellar hook-associated protein FlgL [Paramagnetospirillum magnetotacticum MS-1]|uniref:Flagellar hook-associated protein FlgL n=1 Tax=Paramagnetospirillum magnetotacticum MS-1 TaxID=272627 RepID=A0A0C2YBU9_PARME|nr:PPE-repeat proteins [Paramagnetospirillum magnetotacticum]KIL97214.1 Flagellar hook-associated protein FlgL [Paramagnetospirillum magnetotacticum MS-1]